jgi:hypothetical protein
MEMLPPSGFKARFDFGVKKFTRTTSDALFGLQKSRQLFQLQ